MKYPAQEQQVEDMPEVVVLSDEDCIGTSGKGDRQLNMAIEESIRLDALKRVKENLKRNQELSTASAAALGMRA